MSTLAIFEKHWCDLQYGRKTGRATGVRCRTVTYPDQELLLVLAKVQSRLRALAEVVLENEGPDEPENDAQVALCDIISANLTIHTHEHMKIEYDTWLKFLFTDSCMHAAYRRDHCMPSCHSVCRI